MRSLHVEGHRTERIGWLRAAVLGANDGIVSTASLAYLTQMRFASNLRTPFVVPVMAGSGPCGTRLRASWKDWDMT